MDRSDRGGIGYPLARPRSVDPSHGAQDFVESLIPLLLTGQPTGDGVLRVGRPTRRELVGTELASLGEGLLVVHARRGLRGADHLVGVRLTTVRQVSIEALALLRVAPAVPGAHLSGPQIHPRVPEPPHFAAYRDMASE